MKGSLKRKQFILPQETLDEVKKLLKAKTETEAVLLSLEEVLKRKNIEDLIGLPEKIHFALTHKELKNRGPVTDVLIDTSSWIHFFTKKEKSQFELIAALLGKGSAAINGLILAELLQGVRKEDERKLLEKRLSGLRKLLIGDGEFSSAGHLSALLRQKGQTVNLVDILIAQSAIAHDLPLLHWDSDFNRISKHSSLRIHPASLR